MKNIISRNKLLVIAIVLILAISTGLTFAYFSDLEEATGEASLALKGKTEIHEDFDGKNKLIQIYNTGDVDMVVRVKVFGPEEYLTVEPEDADDWTQLNGYYYYNEALAPGGSTSVLNAELGDVPVDLVNGLEIIVVHESEPAVYDPVTNKLIDKSEWFKTGEEE